MKKNLYFFVIIILMIGCSEFKDRKLLFSCNGLRYTNMTKDSFNPIESKSKGHDQTSLFIGDKTIEIFGYKKEICENGNTKIVFGNCEKNDLVNFFTFDSISYKLYMYDYFTEEYRKKNNFPLIGDSLLGEYDCKLESKT